MIAARRLWVRVLRGIGRLAPVAAFVVSAPLTRPAVQAQNFSNVTVPAGITHNAVPPNCPTCPPTFAQVQSGGAAAGDFDGDGWVDLVVTRYFDSDVLYRNNGDGTFADVTATAFPGGIGVHQTNGAAWGDIDNDGDLDLAVATLNEARHLLYINDGLGQFVEQGQQRGVLINSGLPTTAGTSFAMGDYDDDGFLDMYVAEWRSFSDISSPAQARLFRNLGAANPGHFVDVTEAAGVGMNILTGPHKNKGLSFTPRFSDLDRDGLTDIAVVADARTSRLFWNDGGVFLNRSAAAGIATGTNDMGFTLADFNGDGLLDWFVTSIALGSGEHPSGNRLFLNNGNRTFTDVTDATGVREGGWGWGAEALDFDNDGDLDIAHTNGMPIALRDYTMFFVNVGDRRTPRFVDMAQSLGVVDDLQGRGLLTFDYDRDGDLDMFLTNFGAAPILYRNDGGNAGDWLQVKTIGESGNRDGIGAYITVTPDLAHPDVFYVAEIDGSSTYLAQSEMVAHFGLGQADVIDRIDVEWPSGYTQTFANVAPNQRITIREGLTADFNGDEQADGDDLIAWLAQCGMSAGATAEHGDADRDDDVDGADFLIWQRQLGRSADSGLTGELAAAPLPEPGVVAIAAAVVLASVAQRRWAIPAARGSPCSRPKMAPFHP
jgi:hypothetical protein